MVVSNMDGVTESACTFEGIKNGIPSMQRIVRLRQIFDFILVVGENMEYIVGFAQWVVFSFLQPLRLQW